MPVSFEAAVQIARGFTPLTRHGKVVLSDGSLTLLDESGTAILDCPVSGVVAKAPWWAHGSGVRITAGGRSYFLTLIPAHGLSGAAAVATRAGSRGLLRALARAAGQGSSS